MTAQTAPKLDEEIVLSKRISQRLRKLVSERSQDIETVLDEWMDDLECIEAARIGREAYERGDYITGDEFKEHLKQTRERLLKLKQERA